MVVISPNTLPTTAAAVCSSANSAAVPSGVYSTAEYSIISDLTKAANDGKNAYLILGAKRTSVCEMQFITATCNQLTSFTWTDETPGNAGFAVENWLDMRPNNWRKNQDYLMVNTASGELDDVEATRAVAGAVCGMPAT
ncbi:unnamed protein product [Caenorhabditis angaria]|uniref:C-type lectin domain-containing protein n=1 Tax=Caenorhabditis angaria TaxID=860376 RepID=A0A9P1IML5_9PELO|nr:unnamed protein product [Caenorhabditis angaria]